MIRAAEHFIYLETEHLKSSISAEEPENSVVKELFFRLRQAIVNVEDFLCVIVLPVHSAGLKWIQTRSLYQRKYSFCFLSLLYTFNKEHYF